MGNAVRPDPNPIPQPRSQTGGGWVELNAVPRKDCVYSAAAAPAALTGIPRKDVGSGPANRTLLSRRMGPEGSPDLYPPREWRRAGALEAHALRHHRFSGPRRRLAGSPPLMFVARMKRSEIRDSAGPRIALRFMRATEMEDPGGYDPLADGLKGRSLSIRV